jgi:PiT family inorganic phosphate transporter
MIDAMLVLATLFVAYSNGANDNFRGVATLYGSNTTTFATALLIGTIATLAGSLSLVMFADPLIKAFSGKGLVPDAIAGSPEFLFAVAAGASSTVMLATVFGFPVSTTHVTVGAISGVGIVNGTIVKSVIGSILLSWLMTVPIAATSAAVVFVVARGIG